MKQLILQPVTPDQIPTFKAEMQAAFQKGYEETYGSGQEKILPEQDIDQSLGASSAVAYEALIDGKRVGGAIVQIHSDTQHHHLDFLYVKIGTQNRGIGKAIWQALEEKYPETRVWETFTPYFEQRNLNFYINQCGFHAVEFYNKYHKDPNIPEGFPMDDGFFRFQKRIKDQPESKESFLFRELCSESYFERSSFRY